MASNYITLAELKSTLQIPGTTSSDADLTVAISAASRAIDRACDRFFYQTASQSRFYTPARWRDGQWRIEVDDLVTLTSVTSDIDGSFAYANTWTLNTDFILNPANAALDSEPYTEIEVLKLTSGYYMDWRLPNSIKVTGIFGWPSVPDDIVQATTILSSRLMRMAREAPFGVAAYGDAVMRIAKNDPVVWSLLQTYRRTPKAIG